MLQFFVFVLSGLLVDNTGALYYFEFGTSAGDTEFNIYNAEDGYEQVALNSKYRFYSKTYQSLNIAANGYVTFEGSEGEAAFYPRPLCTSEFPMIAPLWSDTELQSAGFLWYRETTDEYTLGVLKDLIVDSFQDGCGCGFEPESAFIATWEEVNSYCLYDYYYYNEDHDYSAYGFKKRDILEQKEKLVEQKRMNKAKMEEDSNLNREERQYTNYYYNYEYTNIGNNTFQMTIVTNGRKTYVLYNYLDINWDFCWTPNRSGFAPGWSVNNMTETRCFELPDSGKRLQPGLKDDSNIGEPGAWMYRVSSNQIRDENCDNIGGCCVSE